MMALKQIKIRYSVYEQLDNLKRDDESYSIAIQNLIDENKQLKSMNDELRQDKDKLMKIVMKTDDSIALINVYHKAFFGIIEVLRMKEDSDEDKLDYLKTYLRPSLEENPPIVLSCIELIKKEHEDYAPILDDFHEWIINTFPY